MWLLTAGLAALIWPAAAAVSRLSPVDAPLALPWWLLVLAFAAGEMAVVHVQFRGNAHSFSLSEIPLLVGLTFTSPLQVLTAYFVGNFIALAGHRRQPPVKLAFNLMQFTLQAATAAAVYLTIIDRGDPLGPATWLAAASASLIALFLADLFVNLAMTLAGGRISVTDMMGVFRISVLASLFNTGMALVIIHLLWFDPRSSWFGLIAPFTMVIAYRAYITQRRQREQADVQHRATQALFLAAQRDAALVATAEHSRQLVNAVAVEVAVITDWTTKDAVAVVLDDDGSRLRQINLSTSPWWNMIDEPDARILSLHRGHELPSGVKDAILVPLRQGNDTGGYLVVIDRLGDVGSFAPADLKLIETLATQVAVYLENGRLEQSLEQITALKDRLEQLVRAKDQFVAIVSHELRTPLTGIVGLAEELKNNRNKFTDEELGELLGIVAAQGRELAAIVEDLLVAARADMGTLALKPESIALAGEITSLAGVVPDRVIEAKGLKAPISVWADPLRFRQIVRNLLTNAGRYGGPDCWIEVLVSTGRVRLAVVDNGPGVPAGMEEEIFEPYTKANNVRIAPGSVGLGLSVARSLARAMDGDLVYQRRPNGLTAFELVLPEARMRQPAPIPA